MLQQRSVASCYIDYPVLAHIYMRGMDKRRVPKVGARKLRNVPHTETIFVYLNYKRSFLFRN